jgi:DNA (cytosine-5)-methyltransferase 1
MLRVIRETKPRWVIGENVAGFVNMALDEVCASLEMENYEVQPIIVPACAVNAPHRRDRVWIVAHNNQWEGRPGNESESVKQEQFESCTDNTNNNALYSVSLGLQGQPWRRAGQVAEDGYLGTEPEDDTDTLSDRFQRLWLELDGAGQDRLHCGENREWDKDWLEVATELCGVDARIPNRVDRLKSLGNAIVPAVVQVIMQCIKEIDNAE